MVPLTKVSAFRDSSAVEQSPVKRLVVGSNPTRGANKILNTPKGVFLILRLRESDSPGDCYVKSALEFKKTSVDHKFGSTLGVRKARLRYFIRYEIKYLIGILAM
jgi:hypothetical protein